MERIASMIRVFSSMTKMNGIVAANMMVAVVALAYHAMLRSFHVITVLDVNMGVGALSIMTGLFNSSAKYRNCIQHNIYEVLQYG